MTICIYPQASANLCSPVVVTIRDRGDIILGAYYIPIMPLLQGGPFPFNVRKSSGEV